MPTGLNYYVSRARSDGRSLLQRVENVSNQVEDDGVEFDSVLRHLRTDNADGATVRDALRGALDEAELITLRTLRKSVTRTCYYRSWAYRMNAPYPPLQSITSVKYYDYADTLQTLSSSNYRVSASSEGQGAVLFDHDYSFPNLNPNREDPVQIVFVTGYGTQDAIPGTAQTGIRLLTEAIYDGDSDKRTEAERVLRRIKFRGAV